MRDTTFAKSAYSEIRADLDTFDLLLWSGNSRLSKFIQYGTGSQWSHVGMVIKMPGDLLMLWESTIHDATTDTPPVDGVQLTPLSKSITGHMAVRRMECQRTPEMYDRLWEVRKELDGRPFEASWTEFLLAGYDGPFGSQTRDLTTLFCAELIAETLQRVGLLDGSKPSNEFTPRDFSSESTTPLGLLSGAKLHDEIIVNKDEARIRAQAEKSVQLNARGLANPMLCCFA